MTEVAASRSVVREMFRIFSHGIDYLRKCADEVVCRSAINRAFEKSTCAVSCEVAGQWSCVRDS